MAWSGSTERISAAPNAAYAMARGNGDRTLAARSNWMTDDPADQTHAAVRGSGAQGPQAAAPPLLQRRLIGPVALAVHPVAAGARVGLCVVEEAHRQTSQAVDRAIGIGLTGRHDEQSGHVLGGVAAGALGLGQERVLEGATTIGDVQQVVEDRKR